MATILTNIPYGNPYIQWTHLFKQGFFVFYSQNSEGYIYNMNTTKQMKYIPYSETLDSEMLDRKKQLTDKLVTKRKVNATYYSIRIISLPGMWSSITHIQAFSK